MPLLTHCMLCRSSAGFLYLSTTEKPVSAKCFIWEYNRVLLQRGKNVLFQKAGLERIFRGFDNFHALWHASNRGESDKVHSMTILFYSILLDEVCCSGKIITRNCLRHSAMTYSQNKTIKNSFLLPNQNLQFSFITFSSLYYQRNLSNSPRNLWHSLQFCQENLHPGPWCVICHITWPLFDYWVPFHFQREQLIQNKSLHHWLLIMAFICTSSEKSECFVPHSILQLKNVTPVFSFSVLFSPLEVFEGGKNTLWVFLYRSIHLPFPEMPLTSLLLNPLHENVSEQVHVSHYISYSSPNQDLASCVR